MKETREYAAKKNFTCAMYTILSVSIAITMFTLSTSLYFIIQSKTFDMATGCPLYNESCTNKLLCYQSMYSECVLGGCILSAIYMVLPLGAAMSIIHTLGTLNTLNTLGRIKFIAGFTTFMGCYLIYWLTFIAYRASKSDHYNMTTGNPFSSLNESTHLKCYDNTIIECSLQVITIDIVYMAIPMFMLASFIYVVYKCCTHKTDKKLINQPIN